MASEEAALRAKIQAMKNLLQVKQQHHQHQQQDSFHAHHRHHTPQYAQRTAPYSRSYHHHHAPPVNRSWNRFSGGSNATNSSSASSSVGAYSGPSMSANKVWRKEEAEVVKSASAGTSTTAAKPLLNGAAAATANKTWKRPLKVAASSHKYQSLLIKRARSRMQLQVLKLEDGEYAKANGGFSLIRAGVKQPKPASVTSAAAVTTLSRPPSESNSTTYLVDHGFWTMSIKSYAPLFQTLSLSLWRVASVNIGGSNYVITKRGNSLKRMTVDEVNKSAAVAKQSALILSANPASASSRAQAAVLRARNARLKKKHNAVKVRTEYCSFFNRFGKCCSPIPSFKLQKRRVKRATSLTRYCNKRNDCPYIHDSRRVAICRKFLRNECSDANCLLSHKHDQNKMPVCALFLRGACTREDCKYRHVKVSRSAQVCQAFLKGYCPDGESCRLKHELPPKKQQSVQSIKPTTVRHALPTAATAGSSQGKSVSSHQVESKKAALANDNNDTSEQENWSPSGTSTTASGVFSTAEQSSPLALSALPAAGGAESGDGGLSIRPNIRFRPKNAASGFPSLFSARSALSQ